MLQKKISIFYLVIPSLISLFFVFREPNLDDKICLNKSDLRVTKVRETESRLTGNKLFVVYREDLTENIFLTTFEEIDNLKFNLEDYIKYKQGN